MGLRDLWCRWLGMGLLGIALAGYLIPAARQLGGTGDGAEARIGVPSGTVASPLVTLVVCPPASAEVHVSRRFYAIPAFLFFCFPDPRRGVRQWGLFHLAGLAD